MPAEWLVSDRTELQARVLCAQCVSQRVFHRELCRWQRSADSAADDVSSEVKAAIQEAEDMVMASIGKSW